MGTQRRIERFAIDVPNSVLDDLKVRLGRTRWPHHLPGTGWTYGADTAYVRELVSYWHHDFDWRAQEAKLNELEHYRAWVGGMHIHFVHARSKERDAIPLLMLHGWPSSFVQMLDVLPLLVDPAKHGLSPVPSFHVVAASLPGFGFSDITPRPGGGFATSADLMAELMIAGASAPSTARRDAASHGRGRARACRPLRRDLPRGPNLAAPGASPKPLTAAKKG